jgi:hypothetical protein
VHAWQSQLHLQRIIVQTSAYGRPRVSASYRSSALNSALITCKDAEDTATIHANDVRQQQLR